MNVDEPCAPERFRYWDLKEAVTSMALYGDSIGSVNRARASRPAEAGDFRRKWRALGSLARFPRVRGDAGAHDVCCCGCTVISRQQGCGLMRLPLISRAAETEAAVVLL
jgi:hypothetical protein